MYASYVNKDIIGNLNEFFSNHRCVYGHVCKPR
jgi:hypothetical protein